MFDDMWLAGVSDSEEAAALTAELLSHRSYPGEEAGVQAAVVAWFERHGLTPELQMAAPDRPNVIVHVENGDGPTFLLNGHVDTVLAVEGWDSDPWLARREGDRLYGLGASVRVLIRLASELLH